MLDIESGEVSGDIFISVSDYQLSQFLKDINNKGRIMTTGLWRYSRHPNYFGEVSLWWGLSIACMPSLEPLYIVFPLCITYLILKVSGIPMIEARYRDNLEFQAYKSRTSPFWPLPPTLLLN